MLAETAIIEIKTNVAPAKIKEAKMYEPCNLLSFVIAMKRAKAIFTERIAMGAIFDIILLAREYAPNSSGPRPLAKNRMIKIMDITVIREVIVVVTMFFRKGLNFMLNIF